jgi:hypothetical protein
MKENIWYMCSCFWHLGNELCVYWKLSRGMVFVLMSIVLIQLNYRYELKWVQDVVVVWNVFCSSLNSLDIFGAVFFKFIYVEGEPKGGLPNIINKLWLFCGWHRCCWCDHWVGRNAQAWHAQLNSYCLMAGM